MARGLKIRDKKTTTKVMTGNAKGTRGVKSKESGYGLRRRKERIRNKKRKV